MVLITLMLVFIIGCVIGFFLLFIADGLISKKENSAIEDKSALPHNFDFNRFYNSIRKNIGKTLIFTIFNGLGWVFAAWANGMSIRTIQTVIMMSVALIISIIDIKIRIIPDEMVIFMMLASIVFILSGAINQPVLSNIYGFIIGIALFGIMLIMRSNVGGGDVKYIAAMGFCLGYPDIFKAMMIMCSVLLIWLLYLLITKKGGLKTKFAMGPFISIGFVTTLMFQK
ncbi:MAG: prepilin peptidase [Saccharofermentanales bacterium]